MEITLDILLIIFMIIIIIETIYDKHIEEGNNQRINRILNNLNYLIRSN